MAQATTIVLADALAAPVNHTFIPIGPQGSYDMVFEDQSQPSPNGYWRIGYRFERPTAQQKLAGATMRIRVHLMEPVLEAISPAASGLTQPPTVAYVPKVETTYIFSDRSSVQVRKDLRKMNWNLQNEAQLVAMVESLVPVW